MIRGIAGIADVSDERASAPGAILTRLGVDLTPYKGELAVALACIAVGAVCQALGPWLVGHAIDVDIAHHDTHGLMLTSLALFATYAVGTASGRAQVFRIGSVGQRLLAALRSRMFAKFQALPVRYFDKQPIGDLMSRVTNDVETLNQLFAQGLSQVVGAVISLVGILVAMFYLSPKLALASFMVIPAMLLTIAFLGRRARAAFRATRETTGAVMANLQEEIGGVREAQAFNRTDENLAKFRARNASNRDANISATAVTSAYTPAIEILGTLATAVVIGYGSYMALHHEVSVGLVASFLLYTQFFFRPIQLATQVSAQMQAALAGAERIFAILDEPSEPETAAAGVKPTGLGKIELEHVDFAYQPDRPVLRDVSFVAEPGQTIALVGPTGAGKTSIAQLIPRFYDVAAGAVKIDGVDVRELAREDLRQLISVVAQEPFLFGGTVAENLAYGRPEATREQLEEVAKAVGAHEFIEALPEGYDTALGEGGGSLSKGQRQLLSIARAIVADRPILLLDEATSYVDPRTEAALQKALARVMRGRTSLVIAHRLSTIRHADQILVLQDGSIIERGTHDALVAQGGLYSSLYKRIEATA